MQCPKCGLYNPDSTLRCDCGYDFATGKTFPTPASLELGRATSTKRLLIGLGILWIAISVAECFRMQELVIGKDPLPIAWACSLVGLSEVLGALFWGAIVGAGAWASQKHGGVKITLDPKRVALVVTTVVVCVLFVARLSGVLPEKKSPGRSGTTSNIISSAGSTDPLIPDSQKMRIREIAMGVMQDPDFPTPKVHAEFWAIIESKGPVTSAQVDKLRELMIGITSRMPRYFYEDALVALKTGRPVKSVEREELEKHLLKLGLIPEWRITENDKLIAQIAAKEPVKKGADSILFTEDMINEILSNLDSVVKRVDKLFTKPEISSK